MPRNVIKIANLLLLETIEIKEITPMQSILEFDNAIADIKPKIQNTQAAIEGIEQIQDSLHKELSGLDVEVSSLDDITKVETCIKRCRERRLQLEVEQKESEIRLRAYRKTLQNNQIELEDAIEARRLFLKGEYELKIVTLLKKINELRKQLEALISEFDVLVKEADCQCRATKGNPEEPKNRPFRQQADNLSANVRLPYIAFDNIRKRLQYHIFKDRFDYFLRKLENGGDTDNWIF